MNCCVMDAMFWHECLGDLLFLQALPATLGQLQNLELLNLRRNKIDLIIPELGTCARLEEVRE